MTEIKENSRCVLFNETKKGVLEIERGHESSPLAYGVSIEQVLNIAKIFANEYDEVKIFDDEYEAFILIKKPYKRPVVNTYYPEDYKAVAKKYNLYVEVKDHDDTDLEKEKWDNYWGDYNQCGVHVDYR